MTYDYNGPWDRITGHHTPLYWSSKNPGRRDLNIDYTLSRYLNDFKVPASKILLGLAAYSKGWS
jgi:chitinase